MPDDSPRHQRRAAAARARAAQQTPAHARSRRTPILVACAVFVVVGVVVSVFLVTRPASAPSAVPAVPPAAAPGAGNVTPIALPTFGADAPTNPLDSGTPDIGTPTPGAAGPTAVVVTNSPWQVLVARGAVPDLQSPSGVAVDADGNVYVVDFVGDFVQKFSPGGQPLIRFGQKGNAPGQFAGPSDVAVDSQNNIYIADTNNQRIQKLSPTGQPIGMWGSGGDGAGQFWLPSGVAVDEQGKIYVADRSNHRIQVLSASGAPLNQWGSRGPAPGQFWAPSDVAVDQKGQIYVADSTNQRLQVLSGTGQPVAVWGWEGVDPGQYRAADEPGCRLEWQRVRGGFAQQSNPEAVAERRPAGSVGHRRGHQHAAPITRARHVLFARRDCGRSSGRHLRCRHAQPAHPETGALNSPSCSPAAYARSVGCARGGCWGRLRRVPAAYAQSVDCAPMKRPRRSTAPFWLIRWVDAVRPAQAS